MATFFNPDGNTEVWDVKPDGYFTPEEWAELHPQSEPTPPTLDEVKAFKKNAIDANTERIRDRDGLSYREQRFAMTEGAMLKWTGMMAAKEMLQFPFTVLTIDDKPFVLQSQQELLGFLIAVMSYETDPASPLSTGRALRMQVEAATTIDELEAIVDDRA